MREFELIIDEALKNGLNSEISVPDPSSLWIALGFRCGRKWIEGYEICNDDPLAGRVDMLYSWPFPQWLAGERYNFLIIRDSVVNNEDKIYLVADDYTVTHIFDCDQLTFGLGTLMEVADFGEYAVMVNGVIMVYWDVDLVAWHEIRSSAVFPMMRTVCNFKGQIVGGNIQGVWNLGTLVYDAWHDCDETFYCWSKIGEANFTPDQGNISGYRRDPYGGEVYHVRRLEDGVVGYSSKGVILMTPANEPAVTFAFTELDNVGLVNQGAIDGDLYRQVYVGTDLMVKEVTRNGVKELGYNMYMEQLDDEDEDIIVRYDRIKKDFYIGNSTKTYLLSPYGMTEVPQHPSAVWTISSYDEEAVMLPNTVDDYEPLIGSGVYDMNYRGMKTVFSMETDALLVLEPEVAVGWLNTFEVEGFTNYKPLNDEGVASIIISGTDLVFALRFNVIARQLRLTYIKVRYKMTDLRGLRGIYAPPIRGQG